MQRVVLVVGKRQLGRRERGRGREKGRNLDLSSLHVRSAHEAVLLVGKAVERSERIRGVSPRNLSVPFAHERVPNFYRAAPLKDVHPDGASVRLKIIRACGRAFM